MQEKNRKKIYGSDLLSQEQKKSAIALEYNPEEKAPKVIASGKGHLADKIIDSANKMDIPVHKDEKLASSLDKIEIGEYIPKDLYQVVAEVLVYVDAMDKIKGKMNGGSDGRKKEK